MLITCSFAVIFTVVIWNMRKSVSAKSKRDKTDAKEEKKSNESGTNEENHANNVYHKVDEMKLPKKDTIPELPDRSKMAKSRSDSGAVHVSFEIWTWKRCHRMRLHGVWYKH